MIYKGERGEWWGGFIEGNVEVEIEVLVSGIRWEVVVLRV